MKKFYLSFIFVLFLTGCGHNIGTTFNGKFVNIGYDTSTNKVGIQYYSGILVTNTVKANSTTQFEFTDTADNESKNKTSQTMKYKQTIGEQTNGYDVQLEQAKNNKSEVKTTENKSTEEVKSN